MTSSVPQSPDLIACVLRLQVLGDVTLERTQGHRVHALFLDLVGRSDPALAAMLHADVPVKPFTVTPLQFRERHLRAGDAYVVRVAFLRGELFVPFASTFLRGDAPELHVGTARFVMREVQTTAAGHPWAAVTSWQELCERAQPADELAVEFLTPTAFTQTQDARGAKRIGLFPEPAAVFGSLLRRWNALAPVPIPADLLACIDVLPSRYALQTAALQLGRGPQLGFTGHCAYQVRGPEDARRMLATLADAAFFLGVGYKTTQGMGLVRRVEHSA